MIYLLGHIKTLQPTMQEGDDFLGVVSRKDGKGRALRKGESQRPDGRYQYRYTDPAGKRHTIYDVDLNSLRQKEKEILRLAEIGIDYFRGNIFLSDQITQYLALKKNIRYSTARCYSFQLKKVSSFPIGDKPIISITAHDLKLFFIELHESGLAFATINKIKGLIKNALELACEDNILPRNVCQFSLKDYIPDDTEPIHALTKEQIQRILNFLQNSKYYIRYYDMFVALLESGIRICEFCGLIENDLDFKNNRTKIRRQLVDGECGQLTISELKTDNGYRTIEMTNAFRDSIQRILQSRNPDSNVSIDGVTNFVWLSDNNNPVHARQFNAAFSRIKKAYNAVSDIKIDKLTPHVLRHTFCTRLIAAGASVKSTQYLMGHAHASTTLQIYADFDKEKARTDILMLNNEQK